MRFPYDTAYADSRRLLRYAGQKLSYGALLLLLCAAPFVLPRFYVGELTYLFIFCLASLGLMVLTGYTGLVSLGHAAFVGIGAYTHAWLLGHGVPLFISLALAATASGIVGVVIGVPAIRISGLYLAIVTLAFSVLVEHAMGRWVSVTGGFSGLSVPVPEVFGVSLGGPKAFYFLCLACLILVLLGLINLTRTRPGRALVGVRDSEAAARSLGIHVAGYKVLAFKLSAAICGLAGGLMAHQTRFLTPEAFGMMLSMQLLLAVVIGGLGSLRGAILGAIVISLLPTAISHLKPLLSARLAGQSGLEVFMFGLVLTAFVLFEPKGINGRWLKVKAFFEYFPLYRRDTFRRTKAYMRSERYK